jgi:hypothetical protein
MNDLDEPVAMRMRYWLVRSLGKDSVEPLIEIFDGTMAYMWTTPHRYRLIVCDPSLWKYVNTSLSILVGDGQVHFCEDHRDPCQSFDLADPEAEAALAAFVLDRYGVHLPSAWFLPGGRKTTL